MNKSRSAKWQRRLIQPPRAVIERKGQMVHVSAGQPNA